MGSIDHRTKGVKRVADTSTSDLHSETMAVSSGPLDMGGADSMAEGHMSPQNSIHNNLGTVTKTLRTNGTFFIQDGTSPAVNNWTYFPWEYQFLFRDRRLAALAANYEYWRYKKVSIIIHNTGQVYQTGTGSTVEFAGQNSAAKIFTYLDQYYEYSPTLAPAITEAQMLSFMIAKDNDGFDPATSAAVFLPSYVFNNRPHSLTSTSPGVKQQSGNNNKPIVYSWHADHKGWRRSTELTLSPTQVTTVYDFANTPTGAITQAPNPSIICWRWDNYSTTYFSKQTFSHVSSINATGTTVNGIKGAFSSVQPWMVPALSWDGDLTTVPTSSTQLIASTATYLRNVLSIGLGSPGAVTLTLAGTTGGSVNAMEGRIAHVHEPIPALFIGFQNQISADQSGLQNQALQVQYSLEVEIEFSGEYAEGHASEFGTGFPSLQSPFNRSGQCGRPYYIPYYPGWGQSPSSSAVRTPFTVADGIRNVIINN